MLLQRHGLRAQTPGAAVTALAPGSPGTWTPLSCQHQHPNSGSRGVPSTATAAPGAGTALPWDTAFVHSIQPHHASAQPRRKGLGTTQGEQEPVLSPLLAAPAAHHSTSSCSGRGSLPRHPGAEHPHPRRPPPGSGVPPQTDLDEVQDAQLALGGVHAEDEVERGVVPVDQLVVSAAEQAAGTRGRARGCRSGAGAEPPQAAPRQGQAVTCRTPGSCRCAHRA